jgi:uncharacterized protein YyaL (SSP411 family)
VLADWNGLAIAALCRAGVVFDRPDWVAGAGVALDFLLGAMSAPDGRVQHAWRGGQVTAAGLLDDQAEVARGALALFETTGEVRRLDQAVRLADAALRWFADGDGSFFTTASDASDVPAARPRSAADDATPSGNGIMAEVFARLFHLTGDDAWRQRAEAVIGAFSGAGDALAIMPTLLAATDLLENGAVVVVAGPSGDPVATRLLQAALAAPDPAICVLRATLGQELPAAHPAFGKTSGLTAPAAFVCRGGTCGLPVSDPDALRAALQRRPAA